MNTKDCIKKYWKIIIIIVVVLLILCFLLKKFCPFPPPPPPPHKVEVNCGTDSDNAINRDSLADAVDNARFYPGAQEFIVTGECVEKRPVTITDDNVTIRGKDNPVIKPIESLIHTEPVFNIIGARGVTLTGFTVQNGKQGVLVTPSRKKRGAHVVIFDVQVKNSSNTNLCIIGSDEKTYQRPIKNRTNRTYEDCPRPSQIEIERIKVQNKKKNKTMSSVLATDSPSVVSGSTVEGQVCLENDPNHNCEINSDGELECKNTNVNICNSNFICDSDSCSSDSGLIANKSTIYSCHPYVNGDVCVSNIKDNVISGLYMYEGSNLILRNTTLNLEGNEIDGLTVLESEATLENHSKIISNGNGIDVSIESSDVTCKSGSSIEANLVEGTIPPECRRPLNQIMSK